MIYVDMKGNLGNQLFEYAFARKLQEKTDQEICLNNCFLNLYFKDYKFSLDDYVLNERVNIENTKKLPWFMNIYTFSSKLIMKIIKKNKKIDEIVSNYIYNEFSKRGYYLWLKETYKPIKVYQRDDYYVTGFWQCDKYFDDIRNILLEELKPKYDRLVENKNLYKIIEENESICVTIRRGDYVHNEKIRKNYLVCDEEFYYEAVNRIKQKYPNAIVICFSDDIEWVKNNLDFKCETYYENGNDPVWEKLRLMSCCKHFVISNSSFSWWAQYLSCNKNKIVYAPTKWYVDNRKVDIFQDSWKYINVLGAEFNVR